MWSFVRGGSLVLGLLGVARLFGQNPPVPPIPQDLPTPKASLPALESKPFLPPPNVVPLPLDATPKTSAPAPLEAKGTFGTGQFAQILTDPEIRSLPKAEPAKPVALESVWDNGLNFITADKDWKIRVGGRVQFQPTFWLQPDHMKGPAPGNGGIPASKTTDGVGVLDDGMFFRRVRLRSDGVGYGMYEYVAEVNFEQLNYITFDHLWAGMKDLPFLGGATVRIGQHKVPQSMEMIGSDYHLTFLERSSLADAFWTLFAPGLFVANDFFDQNVVVQTMVHRIQPLGFYTSDFGTNDYASTSRVTWTPLYENEGEQVVHVGASYQIRTGDLGRTVQPGATGNDFADTQRVARFRARPELRDATGIGQTLGGNPSRFVDTGFLQTNHVQTISPEFLWIFGPLTVQAEGAAVLVNNTRSVYPAAAFNQPQGNLMFWGGYVQASYYLTGEHRGYDRRMAMFDRATVRNRFGPGEPGCKGSAPGPWNWGAWEVAYRYSYLDLNDKGINGGLMGQHTIGVNWYLNDNFKIQLNYLNIDRTVTPAQSGTIHGIGLLSQWYF